MVLDPKQMAEITAKLDEMVKAMPEAAQAIANFAERFASAADVLEVFNTAQKTVYDTMLAGAKEGFAKTNDAINNLGATFEHLSNKINENKEKLLNVATGIGAVAATASGFGQKLFPMSEAFDRLGQSASDSTASMEKNVSRFAGFFPEEMAKALKNIGHSVDHMKNLENSMLKLEAQAGTLGNSMTKFGSDLKGLDQYVDNFGKRMQMTANATGVSTEQATKFAQELMKLPMTMKQMEDYSDGAGKKINFMEAAIKVTRGSIRDLGMTTEIFNQQISKFNKNGDEILKVIAGMHTVSQAATMPVGILKDYVNETAGSFKFFGDQSEAALKIMKQFGPALRESKLGPEAIKELVTNITQGVGQLNIAQKAFISAQTGGPGGLMGGYQIEKLLKEGKLEEVAQKAFDTIQKQFGGPIVTLEEAAKDQRAAAQLTKQVAFLTQGPLGDLVKTPAQAYKLLEAFKSGGAAKAGAQLDTKAAMEGALAEGTAVQKRQESILDKVANASERVAQLMAQQVYMSARQTIGGGGTGDISGKVQQLLRESRKFSEGELSRITQAETNRSNNFGIGPRGAVGVGSMTPSDALSKEVLRATGEMKKLKEMFLPKASEEEAPAPVAPIGPIAATNPTSPVSMATMSRVVNEPMEDQIKRLLSSSGVPQGQINELLENIKVTKPAEGTETGGPTLGQQGAGETPADHTITIRFQDMEGNVKEIAKYLIKQALLVQELRGNGVKGY
jgi:hypothetical protein